MQNLDTGVISLLIASGTLLLSLLTYSRIQRHRLEREQHRRNTELDQFLAETREMRGELTALTQQVQEMRRLLTEAA